MIVNNRYAVVLKAPSPADVGIELLQMSPRGDGEGLTLELTREEEDFLMQVGGLQAPSRPWQ